MQIVTGTEARKALQRLRQRGAREAARIEPLVRRILGHVKRDGDNALLHYAKRLDGLAANQLLRVSEAEMQRALEETPKTFRRALVVAAENIRQFAEWQKPRPWRREMMPGVVTGQL